MIFMGNTMIAILRLSELNLDYTYPNMFLWDTGMISIGYYPSDRHSTRFNAEISRKIVEDMSQRELIGLIIAWERNSLKVSSL